MYVCVHVCMSVHECACACVYVCACMFVCMSVYTCVCVCVYLCVCEKPLHLHPLLKILDMIYMLISGVLKGALKVQQNKANRINKLSTVRTFSNKVEDCMKNFRQRQPFPQFLALKTTANCCHTLLFTTDKRKEKNLVHTALFMKKIQT